ncbi:MAG: hypothetical protein R3E58_04025 [Phycisphaerae bacterium]|nr:hypothetical protein [Phycisphaerales bacterium]
MTRQHAILLVAVIASMMSCREAGSAVVSKSSSEVSQPVTSNGPAQATDTTTNGSADPVTSSGLAENTAAIEEELTPPPPLDFRPPGQPGLQNGWASIEERTDAAQRAWIEGSTLNAEKVVIETNNVRRFELNLAHLGVNWSERIALKIDGSTSELTKKRWPSMILERTPAGAWVVID